MSQDFLGIQYIMLKSSNLSYWIRNNNFKRKKSLTMYVQTVFYCNSSSNRGPKEDRLKRSIVGTASIGLLACDVVTEGRMIDRYTNDQALS